MAFEGPLLSRVLAPAPSARGRSVYCYVAFMHEPSRFHCHEHMTNYAGWRAGSAPCFLSGSRRRRKVEVGLLGQSGNRWYGSVLPGARARAPAPKSRKIIVFLVFLITRPSRKRFQRGV